VTIQFSILATLSGTVGTVSYTPQSSHLFRGHPSYVTAQTELVRASSLAQQSGVFTIHACRDYELSAGRWVSADRPPAT
jgi:hypothetical protein